MDAIRANAARPSRDSGRQRQPSGDRDPVRRRQTAIAAAQHATGRQRSHARIHGHQAPDPRPPTTRRAGHDGELLDRARLSQRRQHAGVECPAQQGERLRPSRPFRQRLIRERRHQPLLPPDQPAPATPASNHARRANTPQSAACRRTDPFDDLTRSVRRPITFSPLRRAPPRTRNCGEADDCSRLPMPQRLPAPVEH
jgi:hypothetical protein